MVVYHRASASLQRISEARQKPAFQTIPYDIGKSAVALFLNEVLYKCLRQQSADEPLFNYVFNAVSRSEEHTSELKSLMRISYAVFCLKKKNKNYTTQETCSEQILHQR